MILLRGPWRLATTATGEAATQPTTVDYRPRAAPPESSTASPAPPPVSGRVVSVVYAATILVSAFLLFQVQPLIGKIILPWFGGSAAVWSATLLFFQLVLLAGYAYAHLVIRVLRPTAQVACHALLLAASCALLPIFPRASWKPHGAGDPTISILLVLAGSVGLPYFLLSATTPLVQAWYVRARSRALPYRLFALSNLGSLVALLSFPLLVEPRLTSHEQAYLWSAAYVVFALGCAGAGWLSRRSHTAPAAVPTPDVIAEDRPRVWQMVLWVALAACASTLLLAVTNHMTQDIAAIPLLWVVPLAVYLATFILAFESDRIYQRWIFVPLLVAALGIMAHLLWTSAGTKKLVLMFSVGLFVCCLVCHGELARRRPTPRHLTLFYLLVAAGGALGGFFVAVLAPHLFDSYLELPIALVGCAAIGVLAAWGVEAPDIGPWPFRVTGIAMTAILAAWLAHQEHVGRAQYRLTVRNFYGVLSVLDDQEGAYDRARTLFNGTIQHGEQLFDPAMRYAATDYYGPNSGVGRALAALGARGPIRVGSIGLGAGVLTTYGRAGDAYTVYEINPLVVRVATTQFSFYSHSAASKQILLGDARLTLERQPDQQFDLLSVDAFTGDAIPVHLLTREAFALYFRHLKPDGILAVHISNRYIDLAPVCARGAESVGATTRVLYDEGGHPYLASSEWVLVTRAPGWFTNAAFRGALMYPAAAAPGFRAWTDDYSNVLQIFKLK